MPIEISQPVVVPAKPALTADKLEGAKIVIERHTAPDGSTKWAATAVVEFFGDVDGVKTYALDDNGQRKQDYVTTQDVEATSVELPAVGQAFVAISAALSAM